MKIYFLNGSSFTPDFGEETYDIKGQNCVMCPELTILICERYNTQYHYSYYKKDDEGLEYEYYIPTNEEHIFACQTTKDPCYLHKIIKFNDQNEICRTLLCYIDNVNTYDESGYTPLLIACIHKNSSMVRELLDNDADPHLQCNGFLTPYEYCKMTRITDKSETTFNMFSYNIQY